MAKIIKLTPDIIERCRAEIQENLVNTYKEIEKKLSENIGGGKIDFSFGRYTKNLDTVKRRATIYFSEVAWLKMTALIREFSTEVAWHGIAYRDEDETKDCYYITDILVYPQKVSGGNVETDQEAYQTWLYALDDDQFNNLRMQGHSHVNMPTNPSSVDLNQQGKILEQMGSEDFYIFMIWNKSHTKNIKIYDIKKNVLFETEDVDIQFFDETVGIDQFVKEAKGLCKTLSSSIKTYKDVANKTPATEEKPASEKKQNKKGSIAVKVAPQNSGKKKGNKISFNHYRGRFEDEYGNPVCDDEDYDDYDDYMKDPFYYDDGPHYFSNYEYGVGGYY